MTDDDLAPSKTLTIAPLGAHKRLTVCESTFVNQTFLVLAGGLVRRVRAFQ